MPLIDAKRMRVGAVAAMTWLLTACGGDNHQAGVAVGFDDGGSKPVDAGKDAATDAHVAPPPTGGGGHAGGAGNVAGAGGTGGGSAGASGGGGGHAGAGCDSAKCAAMSNECATAKCDKDSGKCKLTPQKDGTRCGDDTRDECTGRDTCKAGVCVSNDVAKGTPCGDQKSECHVDDQCDGHGKCSDKGFRPEGTPCGDKLIDTECDAPDTCNADGVCLKNYAPADAPCGDQDTPCKYDDSCDGQGQCTDYGLWTLGACPLDKSREEADGCLCGNDVLNVCQYAVDVCINGTCMYGREPEGKACGDTSTDTECDKPDACSAGFCAKNYVQTGSACGDHTDTTCNHADACDGVGHCDPEYASMTTSCGSAAGECFSEPLCNGSGSCTATAPVASGTMCGSQVDGECNHADTCDAAGACHDNLVSNGAACGDPGSTACDAPDSCNAGTCKPNFANSGSACGDQGKSCLNNDACDGNGHCADNGVTSPCAFHGTVFGSSAGLASVLVETLGNAPASSMTAANGSFQLGILQLGQVILHVGDSPGYFGNVEARTLAPADAAQALDYYLLPDGNLNFPASSAGIIVDNAKGVVLVTIEGSALTGAEGATISAASAMSIAQVNGNWQSSSTIPSGGPLLFYNVTLGTTTVSPIHGVGETCSVDPAPATQFPVLAHTVTRVHITCN